MRRTLVSLVSIGALALGCGDDASVADTGPASTSGVGSTSAAEGGTTEAGSTSADPSTGAMSDSGSEDSGSTAADGSSSGGDPCGNEAIDMDEVCDGSELNGETCLSQGFDGGELACMADCSGFDTRGCTVDPAVCGDGTAEGTELCDGADNGGNTCQSEGFDSGDLVCLADCMSFDTGGCGTCGNVIVDGAEVCDDIVLLGQTCQSQGFDSGALGCAADCLTYDTAGCGTCGNDLIDGDEICDGLDNGGADCLSLGFDSGSLGACQPDCGDFDTAGCGTCGNGETDGDELCDTDDVGAQTCITQGFDNGDLLCDASCGAYDTTLCGTCGNGIIDGTEDCDGMNLGGATCMTLGAAGGDLACDASCAFDLTSCDIIPQQYDVSAPNTNATTNTYFRGHGYDADGDGLLLDFEVYLGLAAPCDLDFYVYEAPGLGGPYTQLARTTVNHGPGTDFYAAGIPSIPIVNGNYYITGVAWNCSATYYWDNTGAYAGVDAGIGIFNVSHWDNAYPGASDMYVPPNTGGGNTVYVHRVFYAE